MTFVDTGAWVALFVPADSQHSAAREWVDKNHDRLVTSHYVVDEVLNSSSLVFMGRLRFGLVTLFSIRIWRV